MQVGQRQGRAARQSQTNIRAMQAESRATKGKTVRGKVWVMVWVTVISIQRISSSEMCAWSAPPTGRSYSTHRCLCGCGQASTGKRHKRHGADYMVLVLFFFFTAPVSTCAIYSCRRPNIKKHNSTSLVLCPHSLTPPTHTPLSPLPSPPPDISSSLAQTVVANLRSSAYVCICRNKQQMHATH